MNATRFRLIYLSCAAILALLATGSQTRADDSFRPPAVPLVASDPYLSIWSEADHLTDDVTRHWTHRPHPLTSLIRVDGNTLCLMGKLPVMNQVGQQVPLPHIVPAMNQVGLQVLPTRSIYEFENGQVHVTFTFMTPILPHDLEVLTRPVTYLTWSVKSMDGAAHTVSVYMSAGSDLTVNETAQKVTWAREPMGNLISVRIGSEDQPVLQKAGDDMRIDWGYAYLAAAAAQTQAGIGSDTALTDAFIKDGKLPEAIDARMPRAVRDDHPTMALALDLGSVSAAPVSRHLMIAYDEIYAINFFGKKLRPYWRRNGATPTTLFQTAEKEYAALTTRCKQFDDDLMADLTKVGGAKYAQIASLSYRQCLAGCGIAADPNKQPLLFTKENTSNGDIATVDVIFPMDPMLVFFSPTLAKASLVPDLLYAASSHWKFPNAPHDLGTYPIVRGTDDGGEGMPVEESGNMLLLCDAIAQEEGNPSFVAPWWDKLTQWEQYLEKYGNDPEDQLCTDDFMGHLAHNANLSVKAILAIAAYGDLCRMRGDKETADRIQQLAKGYAQHWMQVAADGNHSRLAFDKPNTWSQKYNLVWDRILGLNVFPPSVAQQEIAFYKSVLQPFGVPLDSRTRLTKTDWSLWSASMADSQADFETLVAPIYAYLNQTTARMPLVDSYITNNIRSDGMHARPVVGGIFVKMLTDKAMWKKWSSGDKLKVGNWTPVPKPPVITEVVPTSRQTPQIWRYTTTAPPADWTRPGFDASAWKEGPGGFGSAGTPGIVIHTTWTSDDIWLRREITVPEGAHSHLQFFGFHDEDVEIYVDGVLAVQEPGYITSYQPFDTAPKALKLLKPGAKVLLAVHCHQTVGGQGIDIGLADVVEAGP